MDDFFIPVPGEKFYVTDSIVHRYGYIRKKGQEITLYIQDVVTDKCTNYVFIDLEYWEYFIQVGDKIELDGIVYIVNGFYIRRKDYIAEVLNPAWLIVYFTLNQLESKAVLLY